MILRPLFASLAGCLLMLTACGQSAVTDLNTSEFATKISDTTVQLLDVRTAGEFNTGHLSHALQADWTAQEQFRERVKSLDKNNPVYVYCLGGGRSRAAAEWLHEQGFMVYNLQGGISGWKKAGKPVEQPQTVPQITYADYLAGIPSDRTVLVDIGATWCPPCRKMAPVIDSLEKNLPDLKIIRVDGGSQDNLVKQLNVNGFPTFILYKNGSEVWRREGLVSREELEKEIYRKGK